ncbi:[Fe-Fe] hydrogenase large subunit C-terminal domain-containing protein [Anaerocolumna sp. AGMB13020]|uniref:[Fe-Fe] hydrogenase large subunit C-terminal domain-containing protein n=1 Tax=Anaerocolumna sp. AGMB13020 TaxID=3081750 RepID=UPI0029536AA1|nr:[Fe-Fe] hydrogenase large subunit C-terminal domain-containing protein [Anaerocolumna sp. AGMB13020]WOO37373.1 [Fe-Fe] hydrogenase large subunit C-terminal domain-containing protein [Anaerocolumna sp. AGMB13020]
MTRFDDMYRKLTKDYVDGKEKNINFDEYDPHQLDCLLNPKKYPPILHIGECSCPPDKPSACVDSCIFEAIKKDENGKLIIDKELCAGCCACVDACKADKLTASKDVLPALTAIHEAKGPVYALIAPAFLGQFNEEVTPGKLRNAFKYLGFEGMIEVALFADILTLKEALEFDKNILTEKDYQLTSCCCPMWIGMIRRIYKDLMPHVPGAVSPMVACGRTIKVLHPEAITIFIGPCVAKKAEAREKDISDAVDFVLTFQEVQDIFEYAGIDPGKMDESEKDHSSRAGRIYARTGGVSEAVKGTVERLNPDRKIHVKTRQADGVPSCKQMINELLEGNGNANFFEGMGCVGGCVGGPKVMIDREEGRQHVNAYGDSAAYPTPIDNPYVIELLHRLGFDTVESLLEHSDIFTREF